MVSALNGFQALSYVSPRSLLAAASASSQASNRESLDVTLRTMEGDTVTIRGEYRGEYSSNTYAGLAIAANGRITGAMKSTEHLTANQSVDISFSGDFNDQEWADIEDALQTVRAMWNDFSGGNKDAALSHQSEFQGLETLQAADIDMAYDRSIQTTASSLLQGLLAASGAQATDSLPSLLELLGLSPLPSPSGPTPLPNRLDLSA